MRMWATSLRAEDPFTGELKNWCGPNIPGITEQEAYEYCQNNGLGYLKIDGELVCEIPCKPGTYEPDFSKQVDYDNLN